MPLEHFLVGIGWGLEARFPASLVHGESESGGRRAIERLIGKKVANSTLLPSFLAKEDGGLSASLHRAAKELSVKGGKGMRFLVRQLGNLIKRYARCIM